MKIVAAFGRIIWLLVGLCLTAAIILSFCGSSIVRDSVLVVVAFAAILYFEWILSEMSKKIEELGEVCRHIRRSLSSYTEELE